MNKLQITLSYNGKTLALGHKKIVLISLSLFLFLLLFAVSFFSHLANIQEVGKIKQQLMFERTINLTLAKEINESSASLQKIAQSITNKKQANEKVANVTAQKHISSKIQLYSILNQVQQSLATIETHLSQKVSKFRGVINVAKLHHSSQMLEGINIAAITKSTPSRQTPSNIQKTKSSYQSTITSSIQSSILSISAKQHGLSILEKYISAMPLEMPISGGRFISGFGKRHHPIFHKEKMHYGADFVGPYHTKILATGDGIVKKAVFSPSYGNYVVIKHPHNVETLYAHMSRMKVRTGQKVKAGSVIGIQGSTGNSTGAHVHYEILVDGKHIDPLNFIRTKSLL